MKIQMYKLDVLIKITDILLIIQKGLIRALDKLHTIELKELEKFQEMVNKME